MKKTRRPYGILSFTLLLLLAGCSGPLRPPIATPIATSEAEFNPDLIPTVVIPTVTPGLAPAIAAERLEGGETTLAEWRGKAIILNFWATWCIPCRLEMPALQTIQDSNENIVVVGVNYQESPERAQEFVEELGITFPMLLDRNGDLASELDVIGLPTTFFIDAEGRITGSHVGPVEEAELQEVVQNLQ
jgi:cytochrome c biogenesis protein CcmG, thiol:disulfide interchange protein DsbE